VKVPRIFFLAAFLLAASIAPAQTNLGRASSPVISAPAVVLTAPPGKFTPVKPCRIIDTRGGAPFTGGAFSPAESRDYQLSASSAPCDGLPNTASAFSLNITVTQATGAGFIAAYPRGLPPSPLASTVNFAAGQTIANAAIVSGDPSGFITLLAGGAGAHVIVDVNGYYDKGTDGRAWAYVQRSPTIAIVRSKGFSGLTHPSTGVFCLMPSLGVSLTGSAFLVSVDWGNSSGSDTLAFGVEGQLDCPADTFEVRTYKLGATPANPSLSDLVAFNVYLP
jgi:hypothetical protein